MPHACRYIRRPPKHLNYNLDQERKESTTYIQDEAGDEQLTKYLICNSEIKIKQSHRNRHSHHIYNIKKVNFNDKNSQLTRSKRKKVN